MDSELKKEIKEIIEVVKECPEGLQGRAFEILLTDCLEQRREGKPPKREVKEKEKKPPEIEGLGKSGFENFQLPMRVKAFLKKQNLVPTDLDKTFHVENQEIEPIWSLETTAFSKAQIQIALIDALENALTSGEFSFQLEKVREKCQEKQAYDKTNFMKNFKGSSGKYFGKIDSDSPTSLSDEGMNRLADYIRKDK